MQARPLKSTADAETKVEEDEEEEKRQAELRGAQDQLKRCLEDEDYTGAAALKKLVATFSSAESSSQGNHGRPKAHGSPATATGRGAQLATGPTVAQAALAAGAAAKRVEEEDEEEEKEKRQAELRGAQDQLKRCLEDEDYTGAAAMK